MSPFRFLCITGLFAIFSSTISKSPVLPLFATYLKADPAQVGFIASVSAFTGILGSIPAGILSDRVGRKKMLMFSALVFSTAPFLYLLITELWQLAIVRFYHGLATAVFMPVAMALIADIFHKERGEKISWFSTSTLTGRLIAPIIGGSVIGAMVMSPGEGYKFVYLICGVAGIAVFFLALKIHPGEEKEGAQDWKDTFRVFRSVISHKGVIVTSVVEAAILFAYGTFETFLPLYSLDKGLTAYEVGIFLSVQVIALAITKPVMGRFSDRHGRISQIFAGALIGAVCIGSFSFFSSFIPLLALSILFGLSLSVVMSATSAFIADLSSREAHGSSMGILGSIKDIGHTTGPLVSGIVASYVGIGRVFIVSSFMLVVIAFIFLTGAVKSRQS